MEQRLTRIAPANPQNGGSCGMRYLRAAKVGPLGLVPFWVVSVFLLTVIPQVVSAGRQNETTSTPGSRPTGKQEPTYAYVNGTSVGLGEVRYVLSVLQPADNEGRARIKDWVQGGVDTATTAEQAAKQQGQSDDEASRVRPGSDPETSPVSPGGGSAAIPPTVIRAAVQHWLEKMVVLSFLDRKGLAVSVAKAESDLRSLDEKLTAVGSSLADYCEQLGIERESLLRYRRAELSWELYLERRVTDETLRKWFDSQESRFNGSLRRVAHIVRLPPETPPQAASAQVDRDTEAPADREQWRQATERELTELRGRIQRGELTFSDAAAQHSQGPSATQGGELGWISGQGPMSDAFTIAAFGLEIGQVSPPVLSPHGLHLIEVRAEEPGRWRFEEVRDRVRNDAVQRFWREIVASEAKNLSIQWAPQFEE
jgi:hypothetical protein